MDALIVFAHGSRRAEANEAVERVTAIAAEKGGFAIWRAAFLELAEPTLTTAVQELHAAGATRIVVTPYFLVMGVHLAEDLPRLLNEAAQAAPGAELVAAAGLDGHPALADILSERARSAISD